MRYLWEVWTTPRLQLSPLDESVMALEAVVLLFAVAFVKVFIVDRLRGRK